MTTETTTETTAAFDLFLEGRVRAWYAARRDGYGWTLAGFLGMPQGVYEQWACGVLEAPEYTRLMATWQGWEGQLAREEARNG